MTCLIRWLGRILCFLGMHKWWIKTQSVRATRTERWAWHVTTERVTVPVPIERTCVHCKKYQAADYPDGTLSGVVWYSDEEMKRLGLETKDIAQEDKK